MTGDRSTHDVALEHRMTIVHAAEDTGEIDFSHQIAEALESCVVNVTLLVTW